MIQSTRSNSLIVASYPLPFTFSRNEPIFHSRTEMEPALEKKGREMHQETKLDERTPISSCRQPSHHCQTRTDDVIFLDIDDAIELLGMGPFQRRILWAAGLCFAADSMEVLLLSFLAVVLQAEWGLSDEQTATIVSCVFLGAMMGTLILGPVGDWMGRKPVFLLTAALISVAGFATAAAHSFETLLLLRFAVGFGVGGLTVPFDSFAELVTKSSRGKNLLIIEYFWTAGTILVPILAYASLGQGSSDVDSESSNRPWRLFVILCAIPCLLSTVLGLLFVPESPRWLLTQGEQAEALSILRHAAVLNGKDPDQLYPLIGLQLVDSATEKPTAVNHDEGCCCGVLDLFTPEMRRLTLLLWISWAGQAFTYYGTIIAVTLVFAQIDDQPKQEASSSSYTFDYAAILVSASSELAGTTFVVLLVDRIGRVRTQILSYSLGGICVWILCALASNDAASRSHLIVMAFMARLCFMGGSCTTWVSTAELLTTHVRSTGHSFANAVGRLGASASPYLVSSGTPFPLIGIVLGLASFLTAASSSQLPETAGKRMGVVDPVHEEQDHRRRDGVGGTELKSLSATGAGAVYGII